MIPSIDLIEYISGAGLKTDFTPAITTPNPAFRYGIVRHKPRDVLPGKFAPDTIPLQDANGKSGKGAMIPIPPEWWRHIRNINNDAGYKYARSIGMMWINQDYDQSDPNSVPKAEAITCGGNFIAADFVGNTHAHIATLNYNAPPSEAEHNWLNFPYLYFKAIAINAAGDLINVAANVDCFLPCLTRSERWIRLEDLEWFPLLPMLVGGEKIVDYKLLGASVFGVTPDGRLVYLLKSTKPGERIFPFVEWKLDSYGVIPPAE